MTAGDAESSADRSVEEENLCAGAGTATAMMAKKRDVARITLNPNIPSWMQDAGGVDEA